MTTHRDNLPLAVEVLTAWRERRRLGDPELRAIVDRAAVDAGGWGPLVLAMADLADGLLRGMEMSASSMLRDPARLTSALVAVAEDDPLTSTDVGLDPGQVLDRVGRMVASLPRPT